MDVINSEYIEQKLSEAKYEPLLGIRLVRLSTMTVNGVEMTLIVVRLDPHKQLIPHLHGTGDEICVPLTRGVITLGRPRKDEKGEYKIDSEGKIIVDWKTSQELIPGKPIPILPGEAHHLLAKENPVTVFFYLPVTHLGEDRRFVIYPELI